MLSQLTKGISSVPIWLSATAEWWMRHISSVHWQGPPAILEQGIQTLRALAVVYA